VANLNFKINRNLNEGTYKLEEVFPDIKKSKVFKKIFSDKKVDEVKVIIVDSGMKYMRVRNEDGLILIGLNHLKNSDETILFLDICHELVHVRQHLGGKELYDSDVDYVDRETEQEAYKFVVEEARKLGMNDEEIIEYLKVEWIDEEDFKRLLDALGIGHT
jgi:Zn-dependent peptidase ImmA (M78 family)